MPFDIVQWQDGVRQHVAQFAKDPKRALTQAGITSVYGFLLGSAMLPVIAAYAVDPRSALMALLSVVGGIGGNLVANLAQQKYDQTNAIAITAAEVEEREFAPEYEAIAQKIDVISLAEQALRQAGQIAILEQLRAELSQFGQTGQFAGASINVQQSGGVNFGIGNTIGQTGDIVQGDKVGRDKYISARDTNITVNHQSRKAEQRAASAKSKRTRRITTASKAVDTSDIGYEQEHLQELLDRNKRRLYALELQAATTGSSTSPEVQTEIDDLKAEIKQLRDQLNATAS